MIMTAEANLIAKEKEGFTFALKEAAEEQLLMIEKHIEAAARRGSYMYFYDGVLYEVVGKILAEAGYEITDIYAVSNGIKIYTGINISWY